MSREFSPEKYRKSPHKVVVVAAGPGAGKSSLIEGAIESPELAESGLILPRYFVTRAPRKDRKETNYNFVTREEFEVAWDAGKMFERASYNGDFYGSESPNAAFERARLNAVDHATVIYDLDIQEGVPALLENYPEAMFVANRSYEDRDREEPLIIKRMRERGTSHKEINDRLDIYYKDQKPLLFEGAGDIMPDIIIENVGELAVAQAEFNYAILNGHLNSTE